MNEWSVRVVLKWARECELAREAGKWNQSCVCEEWRIENREWRRQGGKGWREEENKIKYQWVWWDTGIKRKEELKNPFSFLRFFFSYSLPGAVMIPCPSPFPLLGLHSFLSLAFVLLQWTTVCYARLGNTDGITRLAPNRFALFVSLIAAGYVFCSWIRFLATFLGKGTHDRRTETTHPKILWFSRPSFNWEQLSVFSFDIYRHNSCISTFTQLHLTCSHQAPEEPSPWPCLFEGRGEDDLALKSSLWGIALWQYKHRERGDIPLLNNRLSARLEIIKYVKKSTVHRPILRGWYKVSKLISWLLPLYLFLHL
jgi:hypothetical protein